VGSEHRPRGDRLAQAVTPADSLVEPGPTYSEEQVALILQRAAQLERKAGVGTGLSLAEIEAIAREAGMDPSLVRVAARSLGAEASERGLLRRLAGAPFRRTYERVVDGEIDVRHHEALLADLRSGVTGSSMMPPQVASIGRTLTMSAHTNGGIVEVSLTPRAGKTHIRIDVNTVQIAGGLFGGLMGGLSVALGTGAFAVGLRQGGLLMATGGLLGVVSASYGLARTIYTTMAGGLYRSMEQLADRLETRLREELRP